MIKFFERGRKERSYFDIKVPTIPYLTDEKGLLRPLERTEVRKKVLSVIMDWKRLRPDKSKDAVFALALMFSPRSKKVEAYAWPSSFSLHRDWESDNIFSYRKRLALVDAVSLKEDIDSGNFDPNDIYRNHPLISYRFRISDMYARQPSIEKELDAQMDKIMNSLDPKYARIVDDQIVAAEGYEIAAGGHHERGVILFQETSRDDETK